MYASLLIVHILPFLLYDSLAKETNILEYVYVVPHEPEWYSYKNYIELMSMYWIFQIYFSQNPSSEGMESTN